MNNKSYFFIISSILVLVPLSGALYLYIIVSDVEEHYKLKNDAKAIIESIRNSDDLETLKIVASNTYMNNFRMIKEQYEYFYQFILILSLLSFINLMLLIALYKKCNSESNKRLNIDAQKARAS